MNQFLKRFFSYLICCVAISLCYFGLEWMAKKVLRFLDWFQLHIGAPGMDWLQAHPPVLVLAICATCAMVAAALHTLRDRK